MSNPMQQPRQRVVYIRVTKMLLPRSNPNVARNLFQQIQPGYSGVISPLMPIQMLDMYSTTAIPAFRFHDQRKSSVTFIVTELTQFGEKEACRLCLPISWFPHGYVVHHYFPFITKTPENGTPFIELDVHVADIQTTPFSAYYGTLTVIPTWIPPPQMTEGATVLIPQQVKIQQPVQQQNQNVQQPQPQQNQKNKEQNAANDANLTANKDKNKHHHHTHIDDEVSDESEIMLDDLDDVLTDESANQNPPPVLDQSKTNDKQQPRKLFQIPDPEPEQPFEQQPSQKQIQKQQPLQQNQQQTYQQHQFQQQNQQQPYQQQQNQQFQQQPYQQQQFQQQPLQQHQQFQQQNQHQQQQLQQHLLPQSQTQPNKVHYPPFPPLSNQQEFQEQQNHVETKNDHGKTTEEKKKLSNPM